MGTFCLTTKFNIIHISSWKLPEARSIANLNEFLGISEKTLLNNAGNSYKITYIHSTKLKRKPAHKYVHTFVITFDAEAVYRNVVNAITDAVTVHPRGIRGDTGPDRLRTQPCHTRLSIHLEQYCLPYCEYRQAFSSLGLGHLGVCWENVLFFVSSLT